MPSKTRIPKFEGRNLEYYNALMKIRNQLSGQIQGCIDETLDCTNAEKRGVTTHMADVSSDNFRHEMELQMLTENGNTIKLIDDAIERLANGEFGICMDCGEPISEARLMARPYALFCIKCKSRHEEMMKNR
ncbi:MAG: TraR/DksA family transcriptional regulator [Lentisphaeria bacterium]|nr:TraR/DksA family transcriptional regulator [Lentisphaeria bacterium]